MTSLLAITRCALAAAALLLATATFAGPGNNRFQTGNTLYQGLISNSPLDQQFALGYVEAISDAAVSGELTAHGFCFYIPNEAQAGQLSDIVKRYLEQHPERRHFEAAGLVESAFANAFPCGKPTQH